MLSPLSKTTNPENTSQFKLVKDSQTKRKNQWLIDNTIPVTFFDNLLTFRDTGKKFERKGDLLKMIPNKDYNVDHASLLDKNVLYDFAEKLYFDVKSQGVKNY